MHHVFYFVPLFEEMTLPTGVGGGVGGGGAVRLTVGLKGGGVFPFYCVGLVLTCCAFTQRSLGSLSSWSHSTPILLSCQYRQADQVPVTSVGGCAAGRLNFALTMSCVVALLHVRATLRQHWGPQLSFVFSC